MDNTDRCIQEKVLKQFIVLLAVFPIMTAFMLQFAVQQNNNYAIDVINQAVCNAKEQAKTEGMFSADNINGMKMKIAKAVGCSAEQITVETSSGIKYRTDEYDRREMIHYRIAFPFAGLSAVPGLFGLGSGASAIYVIENEIPSERHR